jgi:radical SAM protein with 4Fe4S-binding SPASM domain
VLQETLGHHDVRAAPLAVVLRRLVASIDAVTELASASGWAARKPEVHSLAIELTAFCNQRCDYCYNAWREDGGASIGTPETAVVLARIDRVLDAIEVEHVTLTGGEPLASHDLFPVLDRLRARHVRAQMISNGGLVTDAIAARLARYRLLSVLVTLNGPDAALHDAQVGGAHFEATIAGIGRLRAHRIPVEGSIVLTRRNVGRVGETLALFRSLGVRKIALSRFSPAGYALAFANELVPSPAEVTRALEIAAAFAREERGRGETMTLFSTMPIPPCVVELGRFPEIEFHDCPIGTNRQEFALGPRGELRHCALHRDPVTGAARDVLDPELDLAALFGPRDPHGYRATLPAYCAGCRHAETCRGGCGASAQWVAGTRDAPDPFVASSASSVSSVSSVTHEPVVRRLPLAR